LSTANVVKVVEVEEITDLISDKDTMQAQIIEVDEIQMSMASDGFNSKNSRSKVTIKRL